MGEGRQRRRVGPSISALIAVAVGSGIMGHCVTHTVIVETGGTQLGSGRRSEGCAANCGQPVPAQQECGRGLYEAACAPCHGAHGAGSKQGLSTLHPLQARAHGDFAFEQAVREGVVRHHYRMGSMPPVDDLASEDVDAIVAYVYWMQEEARLR